jgi:hypothetical protein
MAIVKTIVTSVVARTTQFEKGMRRSSMETQKFTKSVNLGKTALSSFGALFAGFSFVSFGRGVLETGDRIDKLAKRLGTTTKDIQELSFIGSQSGVTFEQLSTILQRFQRRLGEAADGNKNMQKALLELGVNSEKFIGKNLTDKIINLAQVVESSGATVEQRISRMAKVLDVEGVRRS